MKDMLVTTEELQSLPKDVSATLLFSESLILDLRRLLVSFRIIMRESDEEEREDLLDLIRWCLVAQEKCEIIKTGLTLGVSEVAPYQEFLNNLNDKVQMVLKNVETYQKKILEESEEKKNLQ